MSRFILTQNILNKIKALEDELGELEENKGIELNPRTYEPVLSIDYLTKRTELESQIEILKELIK